MNKKILKTLLLSVLLLCSTVNLYSNDVEYIHPFKLDPLNDGIILGAGTLLSGSALVCDKLLKIKDVEFKPQEINMEDIPTFDQLFMRPYNNALHIIGTGTLAVSLLSPLIFAAVPQNEWLNIGMMYGETLLIANGIKEWLKILVNRPRPYMYFDGYPQDKVEDGDWNCSFPSGHTTMAFAGAAFTSYLFNLYYPDSSWKFAVTGISFGVAALTGVLRMASGNHFFTDVLTGALIGTISGFAVPYMHTEYYYKKYQKSDSKGPSFSASPLGFNLQIKF